MNIIPYTKESGNKIYSSEQKKMINKKHKEFPFDIETTANVILFFWKENESEDENEKRIEEIFRKSLQSGVNPWRVIGLMEPYGKKDLYSKHYFRYGKYINLLIKNHH